ncbi:hypothetical protein Xcel_2921 [Xylanimonas cellulosilytica DSM 15894]|uniref:Preprotein translocase subunit SecB n=1 Tax=Xylanimonas cellulosilytica (strain DSM 15894 / JCM 12276 / CECT 5975 / KCTC 9989 / LMG 20990 / NBRC 107835 / XIL07) TaxID=446471 RepID=D1BZ31_XYLCX|nr:hypothetical protein [Xylanimonas cellulosilytica]ACZ31928.1 hypothetical protein Xcel_2921 [Xylanimonas cellulosilytica DSM 15894]
MTAAPARREPAPGADLENVGVRPSFELQVEHGDARFRMTVRVNVETDAGPVAVEGYAQYGTGDGSVELTESLLFEFVNDVGIMVLIPYLRQAIADVTQRVFGSPLVMPVMQRGAIRFERPERPSQTG